MNSTQDTLFVTADRDSVCAGDDCDSHEHPFAVPLQASIVELIRHASHACKLASISGGMATWIVELGGNGGIPIAVVAQQWDRPRLLVQENETVKNLFMKQKPQVFFKYWCQASPEAVCKALENGTPLPDKYAG